MGQRGHLKPSSLAMLVCLVGCARHSEPTSGAADARGSSDNVVEASVCEHMWALRNDQEPGERPSTTATSPEAASLCVPELIAHRRTIGDAAFELEATCVMVAQSVDALDDCSIGPDPEPRELCQRVMDRVEREAPSNASKPSEAELAAFISDCVRQVSVERLTADPNKWRTQVDCVRAAETVASLKLCDPD